MSVQCSLASTMYEEGGREGDRRGREGERDCLCTREMVLVGNMTLLCA